MTRRSCAGCDTGVSVAGGQTNLWVLEGRPSGGLLLTVDGLDEPVVLCRDCLAALPAEPTAADIESLGDDGDA